MRKAWLIMVLFIFIFANESVYCSEIISLKDAISTAIKSNHYVKAKEYGLFSVREEVNVSKSAFYPKLFFEERYTIGNYNSYSVFTKLNQERLTMNNFMNPGETHNFQTTIGLEMPLYLREIFMNKKIKNKLYLSSTYDFKQFQEDIGFEVFKAYIGVVRAKSMGEVAEKALDDAKEIARIASLRVKNGLGIKSDELRAFVFLKDKEVELIKAINDIEVAKRTLGLVLSKELGFDVTGEDLSILFHLPPLEDAIKTAVESRKDLISQSYNVAIAKDSVEINKSKYYPKVFLSANYYNDDKSAPLGRDGSGYIAGVYLRWDLFDKTRYDEIKRSNYEYEKAKEYLNQKIKEVKFRVNESYLRVEEARKRLDVAKEALKHAEETFRLIKLRYENNLSTMVEMLDAEVALVSSKTNYVNAEMGYIEALGKALYESGIFLQSILKE
jgi:outer membrane protein TolC